MSAGRGIYVSDSEGSEYIEGVSGLWCTSFGFGEKELVKAATAQMEKLPYYHSFTGKTVNPAIDLAEKLISLLLTVSTRRFSVILDQKQTIRLSRWSGITMRLSANRKRKRLSAASAAITASLLLLPA